MLEYSSIAELCQAAEQAGTTISQTALADQSEQMEQPNRRFVPAHGGQPGRDARRGPGGDGSGAAVHLRPHRRRRGQNGPLRGAGRDHRSISQPGDGAGHRGFRVQRRHGQGGGRPTAGSCGILPGTVVSMLEEGLCDERAAVMALFTAGAIGMVIAQQASIAGAQGGCQAECGSASAMAAAALVELCGGTLTQSVHACAMAIKNQLGLVCDPVVSLVEIPCIKRNVSGIAIAFTAAEMALAGIESKIPADECIQAMRAVGDSMPCALKETAQGGLPRRPPG